MLDHSELRGGSGAKANTCRCLIEVPEAGRRAFTVSPAPPRTASPPRTGPPRRLEREVDRTGPVQPRRPALVRGHTTVRGGVRHWGASEVFMENNHDVMSLLMPEDYEPRAPDGIILLGPPSSFFALSDLTAIRRWCGKSARWSFSSPSSRCRPRLCLPATASH